MSALTPEQREALENLLVVFKDGLLPSDVDALSAALVERNCGTCAHWRRGGRGGVFPLSCAIRVGRWAADDSCNLYDARTPRQTETTP